MDNKPTRTPSSAEQAAARFWDLQLELADRAERDWRQEVAGVVDRYRGQAATPGGARRKRVNILWSNTEILKSALFGRMARPQVQRRFLDPDPVARIAAQAVERVLDHASDRDDEQAVIEAALEDALLAGRGVVWVSYDPEEVSGMVARQECRMDHVYWDDYRESPARTPAEVWWKARRHLMTADDLTEAFPRSGPVALDWTPDGAPLAAAGGAGAAWPDSLQRAEIWEVWDASRRERVWIARGHGRPLRVDDDPYGLEGFFPTPDRALRFTGANGSGVPVPEFRLYADQADELDRLTTRINRLVGALRRRGVYDASIPDLKRLAEADDNEFIPADNYAALAAKGGLTAVFQTEDVAGIQQVLSSLYAQRDALIQTIYEISGISDILRGSSHPSETATAQRIKGQYGTMRLKRRQDTVQRYVRDLFRIKAELIAEHFEPHMLAEVSGLELPDGVTWWQVTGLLRRDRLRGTRIDVETDSTLFEDRDRDRRERLEFLDMVGGYLGKVLPLAEAAPSLAPLVFAMLNHAVRGFPAGRVLEDGITRMGQDYLAEQRHRQAQGDAPGGTAPSGGAR